MTNTECPECGNSFSTTRARRQKIQNLVKDPKSFREIVEEMHVTKTTVSDDLLLLKSQGEIKPVVDNGSKKWVQSQ